MFPTLDPLAVSVKRFLSNHVGAGLDPLPVIQEDASSASLIGLDRSAFRLAFHGLSYDRSVRDMQVTKCYRTSVRENSFRGGYGIHTHIHARVSIHIARHMSSNIQVA